MIFPLVLSPDWPVVETILVERLNVKCLQCVAMGKLMFIDGLVLAVGAALRLGEKAGLKFWGCRPEADRVANEVRDSCF